MKTVTAAAKLGHMPQEDFAEVTPIPSVLTDELILAVLSLSYAVAAVRIRYLLPARADCSA
jgi:hypothetical protein